MESHLSSKTTSESNLLNLESIHRNSVNLDDMLLSIKQEEDVPCSVCNKRKETLARREELAWQREDVIHTREKELRERELMLEEKNRMLIEKEKQLKYKEENVWKAEAVCKSQENSRKSSISDIGLCTFTMEHGKGNLKNDFVLEKRELFHEKEKVIIEKIRNIERKEKSILLKEQQLNDQNIIANKEREFDAKRNHDLESRQQAVRKLQEALETKLKVIYEEKKFLSDKEKLLTQKETILSTACEILLNKEHTLNERENIIIEKERSLIKQINELVKPIETEHAIQINEEFLREMNEIFEDRCYSIQEREATVHRSELVLQEKWKGYSEANKVLQSQEESLLAMIDTFEKEKVILREWEKLLQKQEDEIVEKHNLIDGGIAERTSRWVLSDETMSSLFSSIDIQCEVDVKTNGNSPSCALRQQLMSNGESNLKLSDTVENVDLCNVTPSENREISGDELGTNSNENKNEQERSVPEIYEKTKSPLMLPEERYEEVICPENTQSKTVVPDSKNNCATDLEDGFTQESSSTSTKCNILHETFNIESDKNDDTFSPHSSNHKIETIVEEKSRTPIATCENEIQGSDNTLSQIITESLTLQKREEESHSLSRKVTDEGEKNKTEGDPIDSKRYKDSRTSPLLSTSPTRSLKSPISGRSSPWVGKKQKKPPKDALLQAITKQDYLETVQLLDTNCMPLAIRNDEGRSAVLLAVKWGNTELVERLICKGAEIKACDYKGFSALHIAVGENNPDMVLFLLKKGLNPNVTDINGNTVLQLASKLKYSILTEIINKHITAKSS